MRWFIAAVAAIVLGFGVAGLTATVTVDSSPSPPLACTEAVARYDAFVRHGVRPDDGVIPNGAWAAACRSALTERRAWAWPAVAVGGVALLGAAVIKRPVKSG